MHNGQSTTEPYDISEKDSEKFELAENPRQAFQELTWSAMDSGTIPLGQLGGIQFTQSSYDELD